MRQTRFASIDELRHMLGHSEETEHMIDWIQDAWQTYDLLIKRIGREHAHQIINAMERAPDDVSLYGLTSYDHTNEWTCIHLLN